jgi:hypothetical protein
VSVKRVGSHPYRRENPRRVKTASGSAPPTALCYLDGFPSCRVNSTRRVRIISVRLLESGGWAGVWDLDLLPPEDRKRLVHDVLDRKVVIGHDLSFVLAWLSHLADAAPLRILDSALITKAHLHSLPLAVNQAAAHGDRATEALVKACGRKGIGFSLEGCATAFGLSAPDKGYQDYQNWCVSDLCTGHYASCVNQLELPLAIIRKVLNLNGSASLDAREGRKVMRSTKPFNNMCKANKESPR